MPLNTLFWIKWETFAAVGIAFLAFFDLDSSGLSSTGTCLGTFFEVAFLLDEALLVEGFTCGVLAGTYVGTCSAGAIPLALAEVSLGEETASSTCWGPVREALSGSKTF